MEYQSKSLGYVFQEFHAYFMRKKAFCMTNLVLDPLDCSFWMVWNVWAFIVKEQQHLMNNYESLHNYITTPQWTGRGCSITMKSPIVFEESSSCAVVLLIWMPIFFRPFRKNSPTGPSPVSRLGIAGCNYTGPGLHLAC